VGSEEREQEARDSSHLARASPVVHEARRHPTCWGWGEQPSRMSTHSLITHHGWAPHFQHIRHGVVGKTCGISQRRASEPEGVRTLDVGERLEARSDELVS